MYYLQKLLIHYITYLFYRHISAMLFHTSYSNAYFNMNRTIAKSCIKMAETNRLEYHYLSLVSLTRKNLVLCGTLFVYILGNF